MSKLEVLCDLCKNEIMARYEDVAYKFTVKKGGTATTVLYRIVKKPSSIFASTVCEKSLIPSNQITREESQMSKLTLYSSSLTYGLCANVPPRSFESSLLLNIIEPIIDECSMPDCGEPAVRVAVFPVAKPGFDKKEDSEFRGLCERHKNIGIWTNAETAWGWD